MYFDRQKTLLFAFLMCVGMALAVLGALAGDVGVAHAQANDDTACRGCHGDNERTLTLPSGEELPLLVPLDAFNASAHGHGTEQSCTSCHTGKKRYRYPHEPLPESIQTAADYQAAAIAETCTSCHYAHNPFHDEIDPGALDDGTSLPNCLNCHGAHDVAPFADMREAMPARCVECHSEETATWLTDVLTPHPGVGEGAQGYAGSVRCLGCHQDRYEGWNETRHAQSVQSVAENSVAVVGDFVNPSLARSFDLADVALTVGTVHQQKYITQTATGDFFVLPAQWNVATEEWAPYHPEDWQEHEWRQTCSGCHVTGLETETWEFTEFNIGCESCHGPSLEHARNPEEVQPYAAADDQVCGACHSRGASPDGHPFPTTYKPGDTLTDHFTFTTDEAYLWPDGSAKIHNQQYMDWTMGNAMEQSGEMSCTSCHDAHAPGVDGTAQLVDTITETCLGCHNDKRKIVEHMPYHQTASTQYDFTCADCHMPKLATSAVEFDVRSHSFLQPNPQGSIDHGGVDVMPNACNQCHTDLGEEPEWAVQTIAYAKQTWPDQSARLGPGPTPTSPPPPTPIPSVGQPVERLEVPAGGWLRIAFFVIVGLIALVVAAAVVHYVRTRREQNV